jgi:ADYC domain
MNLLSSLASFLCSSAALLGLVASCGIADPDGASGLEQRLGECDFACGDNGGMIDGVFFWELNLDSETGANEVTYQRFALSEADHAHRRYLKLDVLGSRLRAFQPATNSWIEGTALTGGVLDVSIAGVSYFIKIAAVHNGSAQGQPYWTKSGATSEYVETYSLKWAKKANVQGTLAVSPYAEICSTTTPNDEPWVHQLDALVFEGERYDAKTKLITPSPTTQHKAWFNVACAGSLPSKMQLVRRTAAASSGVFSSTIEDDRQAFARMWAADYCGTGQAFTVTGHKLRVRDRKTFLTPQDGWLAPVGPVSFSDAEVTSNVVGYEAVWGAGGAVCLDTPRLEAREQIEKACGHSIPYCTGQSWFPDDWQSHGMVLTANPLPAP